MEQIDYYNITKRGINNRSDGRCWVFFNPSLNKSLLILCNVPRGIDVTIHKLISISEDNKFPHSFCVSGGCRFRVFCSDHSPCWFDVSVHAAPLSAELWSRVHSFTSPWLARSAILFQQRSRNLQFICKCSFLKNKYIFWSIAINSLSNVHDADEDKFSYNLLF